jgi:hypothetical protein
MAPPPCEGRRDRWLRIGDVEREGVAGRGRARNASKKEALKRDIEIAVITVVC